MASNLCPPCKARGNRQTGLRVAKRRKRHASRIILAELHFDLGHGGAQSRRVGVSIANRARHAQRLGESVLGQQAR
jgi:hypothetical protein